MSHPEQDTLLDLAAAYALGALSSEETQRFEAYLAGSPDARREVAEYRGGGGVVGWG
jgi:anti-sigma factor RsiW